MMTANSIAPSAADGPRSAAFIRKRAGTSICTATFCVPGVKPKTAAGFGRNSTTGTAAVGSWTLMDSSAATGIRAATGNTDRYKDPAAFLHKTGRAGQHLLCLAA